MRNRLIAGKSKRRWIVWGVGYFKPPGEILSRKLGAKSCGFLAVDFWLSCGPQSQLPVEPGTGAVRGQCDHNSLHEGQDRASPRYFGSRSPTSKLLLTHTSGELGDGGSHCRP